MHPMEQIDEAITKTMAVAQIWETKK